MDPASAAPPKRKSSGSWAAFAPKLSSSATASRATPAAGFGSFAGDGFGSSISGFEEVDQFLRTPSKSSKAPRRGSGALLNFDSLKAPTGAGVRSASVAARPAISHELSTKSGKSVDSVQADVQMATTSAKSSCQPTERPEAATQAPQGEVPLAPSTKGSHEALKGLLEAAKEGTRREVPVAAASSKTSGQVAEKPEAAQTAQPREAPLATPTKCSEQPLGGLLEAAKEPAERFEAAKRAPQREAPLATATKCTEPGLEGPLQATKEGHKKVPLATTSAKVFGEPSEALEAAKYAPQREVPLAASTKRCGRALAGLLEAAKEGTHRAVLVATADLESSTHVDPAADPLAEPAKSRPESSSSPEATRGMWHVHRTASARGARRISSRKTPVATEQVQSAELPAWSASVRDARFTPATCDSSRCMARTWAGGRGGQCPRYPMKGEHYCAHHKSNLSCGAVNGPIPAEKLEEFEKSAKRRRQASPDPASEDYQMTQGDASKVTLQTIESVFQSTPPRRAGGKRKSSCAAKPRTVGATRKVPNACGVKKTSKSKPKREVSHAQLVAQDSMSMKVDKVKKDKVEKSAKGTPKDEDGNAKSLAAKLPSGNFVAQDLRFKRKGSSQGTSKIGKMANRFFGKNGKYKVSKGWEDRGDEGANGGYVSKFQRMRNKAARNLAGKMLTDSSGKALSCSFSSAVTPELLALIPRESAEIAEQRVPDADPCSIPDAQANAAPEDLGAANLAAKIWAARSAFKTKQQDESLAAEVEAPQEQAPQTDVTTEQPADELTAVLRRSFHHAEFRAGQREAIAAVLDGVKTLLLLSTGSGKSLCYQLPAFQLREEGITLVISPLLSLMADQLQRLPKCLRGAIVSSMQTNAETREVMKAVRARLVDVLFISPERLSSWAFDGCGLPTIALACVDEAHCVSEWSHNFRPDYLRLHEYLSGTLGAKRLLALTATATRPTIRSICSILEIDNIVRSDRSFSLPELLEEPSQPRVQRSNLTMDVIGVEDEEQQERQLIQVLRAPDTSRYSAIVYVWKKITADQLAKRLRTLVPGGVRSYHGGLDPEIRSAVQRAFMAGDVRVVIATMSFGMGIDKPDIRTVVHYNLPKSIENFIQESGRCSRDGAPGKSVTFVNSRDYKSMRWMEAGGGGNAKKKGCVRNLLDMILGDVRGPHQIFHERGAAAAQQDHSRYHVAFESRDAAKHLNCEPDEVHGMLAQFAYKAQGHVTVYANCPTKLKLRFFGASPEELIEEDVFLRKLLPLAKHIAGVYTIDTAQALALMGGHPGRISQALWAARGNDFSVQKADYGYIISVEKPAGDTEINRWSAEVSQVNVNAKEHGLEKLDACYIALRRAASLSGDTPEESRKARDALLNELANAYFATNAAPASVMAGGSVEQKRIVQQALGQDFTGLPKTTAAASNGEAAAQRLQRQELVYPKVARLVLGSDWPKVSADVESESHIAAQFLAGISSVMFPAAKWRQHALWGVLNNACDFDELEEHVLSALSRRDLATMRARRSKGRVDV